MMLSYATVHDLNFAVLDRMGSSSLQKRKHESKSPHGEARRLCLHIVIATSHLGFEYHFSPHSDTGHVDT